MIKGLLAQGFNCTVARMEEMTGSGKLRLCVLQSSYVDSNAETKGLDPDRAPEVYDTDGQYEWHHVAVPKTTAVATVQKAVDSGQYDVFFNLCDGAFDEDRAGVEVVQTLERCNVVYTGADRDFYEPSKELMKLGVTSYGVKVPAWGFVKAAERSKLPQLVAHLRYPLIVKHFSGYNSVGMGRDAKVHDAQQLKVQVDKFIALCGGALVEQFIEGREFTVLVVEGAGGPKSRPYAYPPIECRFAEGEDFKHFDLKWKDYDSMNWMPCKEEALSEALMQAGIQSFEATRGCGYGRVDFRVDANGDIYLLEINPNCGIFYPSYTWGSADIVLDLDAKAGGRGHAGFIDRLIEAAQSRHASRQQGAVVRYLPDMGGYGLLAARDFEPGETVVQYEEKAHYMVSRKHADKVFPEGSIQRKWFHEYAYPITDDTWVIWSPNPEDWLPINHSCGPNTWLDGLNLVARRHVRKGEQVSVEYATYSGPTLAAFDCTCGATNCRGRVLPDDYLADWVEEYEGHMSDYVATKRRQHLAQVQAQRRAAAAAAAADSNSGT